MIIAEKTNHLFSRKEGIFERKRAGAAISVGGSGYDGWTSLGLTSINLFLQHFTTLVDQVQVDHCANIGAALTPDNAAAVERCRQLGKNVARTMDLPFEDWKFLGDDPAVACPVCHCNILYIEKDFPEIMCPTCEVHGTVSVQGRQVLRGLERRRRPRAAVLRPQRGPSPSLDHGARVGGRAASSWRCRRCRRRSRTSTPGATSSRRPRRSSERSAACREDPCLRKP